MPDESMHMMQAGTYNYTGRIKNAVRACHIIHLDKKPDKWSVAYMEDLSSCIAEKAVMLIPALIILGKIIKSIPGMPCWLIPLLLLVPGVLGTMMLLGWTVEAGIQGVLITGAAVYGNQVWKQVIRKSNKG
ncbi:MAG: phage holin family protein [Bacillota bacterium]